MTPVMALTLLGGGLAAGASPAVAATTPDPFTTLAQSACPSNSMGPAAKVLSCTFAYIGNHQVEVVFDLPAGETLPLTLASYNRPQQNAVAKETLFSATTGVFTGPCNTLVVSVPNGPFQVDFVHGPFALSSNPVYHTAYIGSMFTDQTSFPFTQSGNVANSMGPANHITAATLGMVQDHGDVAGALVVVPAGESETLTLVAYNNPQHNNLASQTVYDSFTSTFGPGCHLIPISVPDGPYQLDLVHGSTVLPSSPRYGQAFITAAWGIG